MIDLIFGFGLFAGSILAVCMLAAFGKRGLASYLLENEMATSFFVLGVVAASSLGLTYGWMGLSIFPITIVTKSIIIAATVVAAIVFCAIFFRILNRNSKPVSAEIIPLNTPPSIDKIAA